MQLFQYAVLKHPTEEEAKNGGKTTMIVEPKTVLAKDIQQATLLAARGIPEEHVEDLDRIEVAVRPF